MSTAGSSPSTTRALLLARLAAERSFLLQQLEGLDEAVLAHDAIAEGWTLPAVLAHLAYWDAFTAGRLGKLADGRRAAIEPIDNVFRDARNAEMRERFSKLSVAEAVALCQKERRGLLLALQRLPGDLDRRVRLRPGWRVAPGKWVRWRWRHDTEHSADMARWRAGYPPNDPALRVIHPALLRPILGLSRTEFIALAELVPAAERGTRPVEGDWTLKQIIGHLADYERLGVVALRALVAGREPIYERTIEDFETFNQEQGVFWDRATWAEAWAVHGAARRALLEAAAALDEAALARPFVAPWLTTTTAAGYLLDMAGHEQEHSDALRRGLGLPRLPRRLEQFRA